MGLHMLVCVTLNLILHISVSHPHHRSMSVCVRKACPWRRWEGQSVLGWGGDSLTSWNPDSWIWENNNPLTTSTFQLPDRSQPLGPCHPGLLPVLQDPGLPHLPLLFPVHHSFWEVV
jgi:hypothetical protein